MPIGRILIDTGPLVALLRAEDAFGRPCQDELQNIRGPAFTCWPVLTEAAWLLRHVPAGVERLLDLCDGTDIGLLDLHASDYAHIKSIRARYADHQLDLADACLMHLAARERIDAVFTLDRRHFSIYRTAGGHPLHLVP